MKNKFFNIFITLLGLLAVYVFYAVWHSEELKSAPELKNVQKKVTEDLSNKIVLPKTNYVSQKTMPVLPPQKVQKQENIIFDVLPKIQTIEKLEEQTQEVYEALLPEEHHELMEEANTAFERLEEEIRNINVLEEQIEADIEIELKDEIEENISINQ